MKIPPASRFAACFRHERKQIWSSIYIGVHTYVHANNCSSTPFQARALLHTFLSLTVPKFVECM